MALSNIICARGALPKSCFNYRVYIDESGNEVIIKEIKKGAHIEGDRLLSYVESWIYSALDYSGLSLISLTITGKTSYSKSANYTEETFFIELEYWYGSYTVDQPRYLDEEDQLSPAQVSKDLFALIHRLQQVAGSMERLLVVKSFEVQLGVEKTPYKLAPKILPLTLPYVKSVKSTSLTANKPSPAEKDNYRKKEPDQTNEIGTLNTVYHKINISKEVSSTEYSRVNFFKFPTATSINCRISLESYEYDLVEQTGRYSSPVVFSEYTWFKSSASYYKDVKECSSEEETSEGEYSEESSK